MRQITPKILREYGFVKAFNADNDLRYRKGKYYVTINKSGAFGCFDKSNETKLNDFDTLKEDYYQYTAGNLVRTYKETLQVETE